MCAHLPGNLPSLACHHLSLPVSCLPARQVGLLGGDATRIHCNPDCGLKTRKWEEVLPSMRNLVAAAKLLRSELTNKAATAPNGAAPAAPAFNGRVGGTPAAPRPAVVTAAAEAGMTTNGLAQPAAAADMLAVFPEALQHLAQADPEVAAIIEDEKRRQW